MVFCTAMQLRYQQHSGIAVVLVSNYATQYNRGFEISGQFFSVHDNYDLVLLSHVILKTIWLKCTGLFIGQPGRQTSSNLQLYWTCVKGIEFSYSMVLKLRVKPYSIRCCCFFQNPLCQNLTVAPSSKTTTTSSKESTTSAKPTTRKPTMVPTKPFNNVTLVVNGRARSVILTKLKHFSDYAITVSSAELYILYSFGPCNAWWYQVYQFFFSLNIEGSGYET